MPKPSKHDIVTTTIPPGMEIEGYLVGNLKNLKYVYHDVTDLIANNS